jgi:DNA-directed RNA polymerase specialized sigma24 family protein
LKIDRHGEGDSEKLISNISSDEDNPEATLLREAQSKTVRLILDAMPRSLREILVLRELEELSYRRISDVRLARSCHVWRAREGHLGMPGAA